MVPSTVKTVPEASDPIPLTEKVTVAVDVEIVREYVVVLVIPPPVPVIVMVYVPVGVEVEVDVVMVEDAVVVLGLIVTLLGLKLAEAPEGSPEAERLMVLEL